MCCPLSPCGWNVRPHPDAATKELHLAFRLKRLISNWSNNRIFCIMSPDHYKLQAVKSEVPSLSALTAQTCKVVPLTVLLAKSSIRVRSLSLCQNPFSRVLVTSLTMIIHASLETLGSFKPFCPSGILSAGLSSMDLIMHFILSHVLSAPKDKLIWMHPYFALGV